ncbi:MULTISPECIES: hypothetical protein [unclassified Butyrivibrio]|uniref:hypothetical protein n=1 Tax=unclassified Butyrivibrio TaxID=2639466 RepID=UPI0003B6A665|nr:MULTISPECIES: hypothetical protein [unclassified Butyrivibrio]
MSKKSLLVFTSLLTAFILSACGLSEENLAKMTETRDALTAQKNDTQTLYEKLTTEDYSDELSDFSAKYEEFNSLDFEKLKDKDAEELIPQMEALTQSYKDLYSKMDKSLEESIAAADEAAKHTEVLKHIENHTGYNLTSIIFKDVTTGAETENYLKEGSVLEPWQILSGVTLPLYADSTEWSFVTTDTEGNIVEYPVSSEELNSDGQSIIIIGSN